MEEETPEPPADEVGEAGDVVEGASSNAEQESIDKIEDEINEEDWFGEEAYQEIEEEQESEASVEEIKSEQEIEAEHGELEGEEVLEEEEEGEEEEAKEEKKEVIIPIVEEIVEEEAVVEEEQPPNPADPYNLTDSSEALKPPFELRPDQVAECEQLWALYQNYTPAYSDIDGYITEVELVYLLKNLLLMTYTIEQMHELIEFCVRPPDPHGHITFEQFLKIVTIRQRDLYVEDEMRMACEVYDPDNTGLIDREFFREAIARLGFKIGFQQASEIVKEVDLNNDGTLGIDEIVGTFMIDLNPEDIENMRLQLNPPKQEEEEEVEEEEL